MTAQARLGRAAAAAAAFAVVVLTLLSASVSSAGAISVPEGFRDETVFEGLNQPTAFKFAPDGRTFVALKGGQIMVFPKGASPRTKPTEFVNLAKEVYDYGDKGLLGIALDPKFEEGRPYVYALYSYDYELGSATPAPKYGTGPYYVGDPCPTPKEGCVMSGRLVRLTAEGNHAKTSAGAPEEKVLLEGWCQQFSSHSIGDLGFGPEGALFVSGGEGASFENPDYGQFGNPCNDPPGSGSLSPPNAEGGSLRSQSPLRPSGPTLLNGALVRIDPDTGEGWPGNPYAASSDANKRRIVAFGFRNPFRFVVDPKSKSVFVDNVGNGSFEEIDKVAIGASTAYNSGWPCYEGSEKNYQFEAIGLEACQRLYSTPGSTSKPFFEYAHTKHVAPEDPCPVYPSYNGSAISGNAFYEGSTYPEKYNRALFFADAVRGCMYAMLATNGEPNPAKVVPFFFSGSGTYPGTDLEQGPDGDIYYGSVYGGSIHRFDYGPGVPNASLSADKTSGAAPLTVHFNAGASTGEGNLTYEWDLDGDGEFDDGTGVTQEFTYSAETNVEPAVRVRSEATGKSAVARLVVYPGDLPPNVTISKPLSSLTWGVGQQIAFAASATDKNGAQIPAANFSWDTRVLHCPAMGCHEHPLQTFPGVKSGTIAAPNHEYPSAINFILTVTDSRGLSATKSVEIKARPVGLQINSEPPGVPIAIGADQDETPTPFEALVVEGSPTTLTAPEKATIGGVTYTFEKWSDGGSRVHNVPAKEPGTFTAVYRAPVGPPAPGPTPQPIPNPTPTPTPPAPEPPATLQPPTLETHPARQTTSTQARFVFGAAGGSAYRCKLDKNQFASCRSPRTYRKLKPGTHQFKVYGLAASGERGAATSFKWKVLKKR